MASKKYKDKTCAYCGGLSSTGDHVVARQFFAEESRGDLLIVPSCEACNGLKASLEHYATAVLPFGSNHETAQTQFPDKVQSRLDKNLALKRHLKKRGQTSWHRNPGGILVPTLELNIDREKIERLFGYIGQGLLFHHFETFLAPEHVAVTVALTDHGVDTFYTKFFQGISEAVEGAMANNGFRYIGRQGTDYPELSVWLIQLYMGIGLQDRNTDAQSTVFGVYTCHQRVVDDVRRYVQFA